MTSPDLFSILSSLQGFCKDNGARRSVPTASLHLAWLCLLIFRNHHHSRPWTCLLPACQALTYYTFHHCTLEHLVMLAIFPGTVFCLLSTLMQQQQESESRSGFDHCSGLGTWHAERTMQKLQKETSSPSPTFLPPCFLLQISCRACGLFSVSQFLVLSALPVSPHRQPVHAIFPLHSSQADPMGQIFSNPMPNTSWKPLLVGFISSAKLGTA